MMNIFDLRRSSREHAADVSAAAAPRPRRMRPDVMKRLQIGLIGLATMILLVGLSSVITQRASETDATRVPEASATVAPEEADLHKSDPLVDAGVVPDLPITEPVEAADTPGPVLPEQGVKNAPR